MTLSGSKGIAASLHPGVVRTELGRYINLFLHILIKGVLSPLYYLLLKSPREGAQTTLYTVLEENDKLEKGAHYKDCKVCPSSQFTMDM